MAEKDGKPSFFGKNSQKVKKSMSTEFENVSKKVKH